MYYISRLRVQCNKPDEGQANADDEIMNITDFIVPFNGVSVGQNYEQITITTAA